MWELLWNSGPTPVMIELVAIFLLPFALFMKVIGEDIRRMRLKSRMKNLMGRVEDTESRIQELNDYIQMMHQYIQERVK